MVKLTSGDIVSLLYHDIFSFPLSSSELVRWVAGERLRLTSGAHRIYHKDNIYYLRGKEADIESKRKKAITSKAKMKILASVKPVFEAMDDIQMVAVTGSLAMLSAPDNADIDLMFVTRKGSMWKARLNTIMSLKKQKVPVRSARNKDEKDKLCLNVWMEEGDLRLSPKLRSAYTAHEIAQILPIIDKNSTYARFLAENSWTGEYWPNATTRDKLELASIGRKISLGNELAYLAQKAYMRPKRTRETVTKTRAFFHPFDWSARVDAELAKRGVVYR